MQLDDYLDDVDIRDLRYGVIGPITKTVARELDGGPARLWRLGTAGGGRCLLSAWLGIDVEGLPVKPPSEAKADCDSLRANLKAWLLQLPAYRQEWLARQMFHSGNSGLEGRGDEEEAGIARAGGTQQSWETLLRHLSNNSTDLGWECVVVLSEMERVNVLAYCHLEETTQYDSDTRARLCDGGRRRGTGRRRRKQHGRTRLRLAAAGSRNDETGVGAGATPEARELAVPCAVPPLTDRPPL